jgi:hypothetical protein
MVLCGDLGRSWKAAAFTIRVEKQTNSIVTSLKITASSVEIVRVKVTYD